MREVIIGENDKEQRLDRFLKKYLPKAPNHLLQKYIRTKKIKVNKKRAQPDQILNKDDVLNIYIYDEVLKEYEVEKERELKKVHLDILYEDEDICLINKPVDMLSHPAGPEDYGRTIVDHFVTYLIIQEEYIPRKEKSFVPALANRLDRNTSGLIMGCKNAHSLKYFNQQFRGRNITKIYRTICKGNIRDQRITKSLEKDEEINKVEVRESGKESITKVRNLHTNGEYSYIEIELITGRTHQIRAHLAAVGHPVIGDIKYGDRNINKKMKKLGLSFQLLHSYGLEFNNIEGHLNQKKITAPLPENFLKIYRVLFGGDPRD
ncbi:RluA family pseudouridine synthase [Gallicola sp. Sow4_E12]|uniref:RluA family pseudouridine synthase n=1 Tax=Gallicola sp. Sow4_E12 TaxID=3438785 RepID=UPI003F92D2A2